MKTYIVGHKNPDTDSVVSAIALSYLENQLNKPYQAAIAGKINKETEYVLRRFRQNTPEMIPEEEKKVLLVDHNEPSQISDRVKPEEIQCIIDHHKLGGLSLPSPISMRTKAVGSTATMIAHIFKQKNVEIPKDIACILLAGTLSDTLNLTSPTTTKKDRKAVESLVAIADVEAEELAAEMFKAKSDITGVSIADIIGGDYKIFDMKGKNVGIGVCETVLPESILAKKNEIMEELKTKKNSDKLDYIFYAVVDVIKQVSIMFSVGNEENEIIKKAFKAKSENGLVQLPGVVSRKKQIAPVIEESL